MRWRFSGVRVRSISSAKALIAAGALAVGGCSTGSERWSSTEFRLNPSQPAATAAAVPDASSASPATPTRVAALPQPAEPSGGYLQLAKVELPPLTDPKATASADTGRVRTADGYGAYNKPPVTDGSYAGPRVRSDYDAPRDDAPVDNRPPPRLEERWRPSFTNPDGSPRVYDRVPSSDAAPDDGPIVRRRRIVERPIPADVPPPYEPRPYAEPRPYSEPAREFVPPPPPPPVDYTARSFYTDRNQREIQLNKRDERSIGEQTAIKRPNDPVASDRGAGKVVTVAPGETLYTLAVRYNVSVKEIINANGLQGQRLRPGQDILIPTRPGESFASVTPAGARSASACAAPKRCHTVARGETLTSIAKRYAVPEARLAEANSLAATQKLNPGQVLTIPEAQDAARAEPAPEPASAPAPTAPIAAETPVAAAPAAPAAPIQTAGGEQSCDAALSNPLPRSGKSFRKPVEGLIITQFGPQRNGTLSEGVAISVPKGTPVKAAENGVVAYVGEELQGFGKLILIRHADDYVTAYAHSEEILVKRCDVVKRGQVIAKAGASGDVNQPQVHFEIRKNAKPIDPVPLLSS
jgi:murein DD-endopeptidase MepM/ murein hydrolase activator NlpD